MENFTITHDATDSDIRNAGPSSDLVRFPTFLAHP